MLAGHSETIGSKYPVSSAPTTSPSPSLRTSTLYLNNNPNPWDDILPNDPNTSASPLLHFLDLTPFLRQVKNGDLCLLHFKYRD